MENVNQFTLAKMWEVLKKYLLWIILAAVIVGCVAAIFGQVFVDDQYTCRLEYLLKDLRDMSSVELNNMSIYIDDAIRKLSSNSVVKEVVEAANIRYKQIEEETYNNPNASDLPVSPMKNALKITANTSESGFYVTVTYKDPVAAYAMTRTYSEKMESLIEGHSLKEMELINEPEGVPLIPSNNNRALKVGLIAAAIAAVLAYAAFLIRDSFDVTIRTEQDLKKFIDLPLLGMIPQYSGEVESGEKIMNKSHGDKDKDKKQSKSQ